MAQSTCFELYLRYRPFELWVKRHLFRVNAVLFCGESGKVKVKTTTNRCTFPESQKNTTYVTNKKEAENISTKQMAKSF